MFFCFLTFFFKMAVLITLTIAYSLLFSLFFFIGLCYVAGPSGSCGNISCCVSFARRSSKAKGKVEEVRDTP